MTPRLSEDSHACHSLPIALPPPQCVRFAAHALESEPPGIGSLCRRRFRRFVHSVPAQSADTRSSSYQSILQSVVDTASQLCRADVSVIFRLEGGVYRFAAGYSLDPAYLQHERRTPISPGPGTVIAVPP